MGSWDGRGVRRSLCVASVGWLAALVAAAYVASGPAVAAAQAFAFAVYGVGSVICHQRPERSLYLWGVQLPVCARCVGVYIGAALSTLAAVRGSGRAAGRPSTRQAAIVLGAGALPTCATLAYEWASGVMPGGGVRALSGMVLGASMSWLVLACVPGAPKR